MLRQIVERYIQKTKNKNFHFDKGVSTLVLVTFLFQKLISFCRGLKFYHLKRRGKLVLFGRRVRLFNKKSIIFGNNVNIGDYVTLYALGHGNIKLGNNVNIGSFSQVVISTTLHNLGKYVIISDNVGIGEYSYLGGGGGTTIGANTIIGQYFSTHPENHNFLDSSLLIREQGVTRKGIYIGENCWVGSRVTVLDGVTIGDNSVIAAGSVVSKSFPNNSLIGGVPAKLLKKI